MGIGRRWPEGCVLYVSDRVTFGQYDDFCDATGHEKPEVPSGRGKQPVVNMNVGDAVAFCNWLSKKTGKTVRLPEEDEWVFAARGGSENGLCRI